MVHPKKFRQYKKEPWQDHQILRYEDGVRKDSSGVTKITIFVFCWSIFKFIIIDRTVSDERQTSFNGLPQLKPYSSMPSLRARFQAFKFCGHVAWSSVFTILGSQISTFYNELLDSDPVSSDNRPMKISEDQRKEYLLGTWPRSKKCVLESRH
jgi:hypothetical protein